ncbi:MAG: hypothetical protein HYS27_10640 [Deltaproteobacteria bacterium]|nr:hypothetical protein [Deltaproteobacteria bacterium]
MPKHAELLARFSADFGVPFLRGARCTVSSPLGNDGLLAIRNGLSVDTALADACERQIEEAAHLADLTPAPFDEDAGTLLYAVHELFACTHPQASSFYARAHLFCRAAAQEVLALPHTFDAGRLLTRHLVVGRAFGTTRTDVHVKWWTGNASFYGADVPKRLTAWPGVRRVNVDRRKTPMWKLALSAGEEELRVARAALMVALLDVSPMTRLWLLGDPAQKALGFSLVLPYKLGGKKVSPLDALEDRALARAVVDRLVDVGVEVTGPPLALALLSLVREDGPPRLVRRAVELCTHLALTLCLIQADAPGAEETSTLREVLDGDLAKMSEPSRVYWSTVAAAFALDGTSLALPTLAELPPRAAPLWARLRERLTHKRVSAVSVPLERELRRRLPAAGDTERVGRAPG